MNGAAVDRNRHFIRRSEFQFALRAFDSDRLAVKPGGDAGRNEDGLLANAGHGSNPFAKTPRRLKDGAQYLAADVVLASGMVGHDALRRRDNRHAKAVGDARHRVDRRVDPAARFGYALDLADDRLVVEVFQLDFELGATVAVVRGRIAADIAFRLQYVENLLSQGRTGSRNFAALAHLRVADAGEHIAEGIVHVVALLTSST